MLRKAVVRVGRAHESAMMVMIGNGVHVKLMILHGQLKTIVVLLVGTNEHVFLLVLASLVLKPNTNHARIKAGYFYKMLFQHGIWSWICVVAGSKSL